MTLLACQNGSVQPLCDHHCYRQTDMRARDWSLPYIRRVLLSRQVGQRRSGPEAAGQTGHTDTDRIYVLVLVNTLAEVTRQQENKASSSQQCKPTKAGSIVHSRCRWLYRLPEAAQGKCGCFFPLTTLANGHDTQICCADAFLLPLCSLPRLL